MRRPILAVVAALVLLLAACNPTPAAPVDLSQVTASIDALSARVDALAGRIDLLGEDFAAVSADVDGLDGKVAELTQAALDLRQVMSQPLDLANIQWGALTGVVVQTVPATAEVTIEPGECPTDLSRGHAGVLGIPIIGTSFHAAPAGTHCLRTLADETHQESGVTVTIPDGVIVTAALLPLPQPVE